MVRFGISERVKGLYEDLYVNAHALMTAYTSNLSCVSEGTRGEQQPGVKKLETSRKNK